MSDETGDLTDAKMVEYLSAEGGRIRNDIPEENGTPVVLLTIRFDPKSNYGSDTIMVNRDQAIRLRNDLDHLLKTSESLRPPDNEGDKGYDSNNYEEGHEE